MLKEIYEQPRAIKDTYRGRLLAEEGLIKMAGIEEHLDKFLNAKRIIITCLWYLLACWFGGRVYFRRFGTHPGGGRICLRV